MRAARVAKAYMSIADSCKRDGVRVRFELDKALEEKKDVEVQLRDAESQRATWIQVAAGAILLALLALIFK